jgi:hypothetical protein
LQRVVAALNKVDNISEVKLEDEPDVYAVLENPAGRTPENRTRLLPIYIGLSLSFEIYLPERVQQAYLPDQGISLAGCEKFTVRIDNDGEFPVTYVFYETNSPEEVSPADAIVFIRNYLQEKILKIDPQLVLEVLGPTPLHAQIFLAAKHGTSGINHLATISERPGYPDMFFGYPIHPSGLPLDPVDMFSSSYTPILGVHYYAVMYRNELLRQHAHVYEALDRLLLNPAKLYFGERIRHFFGLSERVRDVMSLIIENEKYAFGLEKYVAEKSRKGDLAKDSPFYSFVEGVLEDRFPLPVEKIRDVIRIVEDRRLRYIQNSISVFAALLGVVVGGLLTYFVTGGTRPK